MGRLAPIGSVMALLVVGVIVWMVFIQPKGPDLALQIQTANAVLEQARVNRTVFYDPALNWQVLPEVSNTSDRKALFIAKVLPLIAEQNERVLAQRTVAETAAFGSPTYNALIHSYGLKSGASREALLARVDIIPESLTLAQAAIESGWGTSRFAKQGNAFFGERTYNPDTPGMTPLGASGFKVKSFDSAIRSIRSFMKTLNTHKAYRVFRAHRAQMRQHNKTPTGLDLVVYLKSYSEIGDAYIQRITDTIQANALGAFDDIAHVDH